MNDLLDFLNKNNAIGLAIGGIVAAAITNTLNSFNDNMIIPTVIPLVKKLFNSFGIDEQLEINYKFLHLKIGKFIKSMIHLLITGLIIMYIAKYLNSQAL